MPGARRLIDTLKERGTRSCSPAPPSPSEMDHYIDLLDVRDVIDDWTSSADVEATKPDPDLVKPPSARPAAPPRTRVMVGDTTWDCEAAGKAGVPTVGLLSGGFSAHELLAAGAPWPSTPPRPICSSTPETPLAA